MGFVPLLHYTELGRLITILIKILDGMKIVIIIILSAKTFGLKRNGDKVLDYVPGDLAHLI
ncbi:MAG TPA: hypothetical protein VEL11_10800 [Candidatus Bathyarchaeia archaeon]|nr:hypothetical protein [Candidatus Bathyarchaeia archaeon]